MIIRLRVVGYWSVVIALMAVSLIPTGIELASEGAEPAAAPIPQLFVMNGDGTDVKPLVTMADYDGHGSPTISADGKLLAFDGWRASAGESAGEARVIVANVDGSEPKVLGAGAMPSFSPDGKRIAFTRYSPSGVWMMNADGSEPESIDPNGWSGHWSPDGRSLAYAYQGGDGVLAVFDLMTKTRRMILEGDQADRFVHVRWNLCWSPDSKWVCFKGQRRDEKFELAICHVDGSTRGFKTLFEGDVDEDAAWHPDGKQILVSTPDVMRKAWQFFLVDTQMDSRPRYLPGQPDDRDNVNACWTPDGKQIIFATRPRPVE